MTAVVIQPQFAKDSSGNQVDTRPAFDLAMIGCCLFLAYAAAWNQFGFSRDFFEYLSYYNTIPPQVYFQDTRFEPGFHLFSWLFSSVLQLDIAFFIFTLAITSLLIKFYLFRRHLHHYRIAFALYLILFYPIHEYTQYRAGISLAFGYLAVHMLMSRRWAWSAALFFLALSFHYSSILLLLVSVGALVVRRRAGMVVIGTALVLVVIGVLFSDRLSGGLEDVLTALNPLSGTYLENTAMIEGVSLFSVNNLLLIAALACYALAGYYSRSGYHALFFTMAVACLVPIALLPDAPVISQRSKEVLFVAVVFLACRSRLGAADIPGFAFVTAMTGLLGYLAVSGGVIFS